MSRSRVRTVHPLQLSWVSALSCAELNPQREVLQSLPSDKQGLEIKGLHFRSLFFSKVPPSSEITSAMDEGTVAAIIASTIRPSGEFQSRGSSNQWELGLQKWESESSSAHCLPEQLQQTEALAAERDLLSCQLDHTAGSCHHISPGAVKHSRAYLSPKQEWPWQAFVYGYACAHILNDPVVLCSAPSQQSTR